MSFTADKKFDYDKITLRFPPKQDEVLQVSDLEGNVIWSRNLAKTSAAFSFDKDEMEFQIGQLEAGDFERKMKDTDRRAQMTFLLAENDEDATSTFIGIADLRDGRLAHLFNLGEAPLEISAVTENGVRYWVLRSIKEEGKEIPKGFREGDLLPKL